MPWRHRRRRRHRRRVRPLPREAIDRARRGDGPTLLEARIRRLGGHYVGDPEEYRSRDDRRDARSADPITRPGQRLETRRRRRRPPLVSEVETATVAELDAAFADARAAPLPDPTEVERDVFAA